MIKADELFRQFGFGKTTVADIAAELGMSPANIYKFFSSKEAIIQASADRNVVALAEAVHRHMAVSGAALDRSEKVLLTVYRHTTDILRNERQVFKLMIRAYKQKWDCVEAFDKFLLQTLAKLVREGMSTGEFKSGESEIDRQIQEPAIRRERSVGLVDALEEAPPLRVGQLNFSGGSAVVTTNTAFGIIICSKKYRYFIRKYPR